MTRAGAWGRATAATQPSFIKAGLMPDDGCSTGPALGEPGTEWENRGLNEFTGCFQL